MPSSLPTELTSFIGRRRELQTLETLLAETRLCTITGAGGSGKTRLALRVARRMAPTYPDGVCFVEFGSVSDPGLFTPQLAMLLDVSEVAGRDRLDALTAHLARSRMLVVLDGCEHLVDIAARVVDQLLRACPHLTFLVTSQEALNVPGEMAWRIPSLSLPAAEEADLERLKESDAMRLFVERARLVSASFEVSPGMGPALAELCRRLDGLPLAIELAAARIRVMPVEEMLRHLEDRFRLLTGGSRTAMARQQTLRATVDWSYQQLTPEEQTFFRRLSVFSGSFGLDAVEAVCGDQWKSDETVLELLSRLVDRSLVVPDSTGVLARYRLLETLRQYGQERLRDSGEEEVRVRHAEYFVGLAEKAEPKLSEPEQLAWFDRLELDHDNLRSALAWSATEDQQLALRLIGALGRYWYWSGHVSEVREWLSATLAGTPPPSKHLARALWAAGVAALWSGNYQLASRYGERAVNIARSNGESVDVAKALNLMGIAAQFGGDSAGAVPYLQEALAIRSYMGDRSAVATSLNNLGLAIYDLGRLDEAENLLTESLAILQDVGASRDRSTHLDSLARVKLQQGDLEAARLMFAECLDTGYQVGDRLSVADGLEGLARIASRLGNYRLTVMLAASVSKQRQRIGYQVPGAWAMKFAKDIEHARGELGKQNAAAAWTEGLVLSVPDAINLALNGDLSTGDGRRRGDSLTDREWQVAGLIVEGLSNRQIAGRLHLSDRTVDAHVEHIRNKLGLHSRAQIAAWVEKSKSHDAASAPGPIAARGKSQRLSQPTR